MAWAQEMGALVRDIKTSHRDRTHFVNTSKKSTHDLLADYKRALKEMADDLRAMLDKSESSRKHDFNSMMEGIHGRIRALQARVKEVRGDAQDFLAQMDKEMKELASELKDFLAKSESTRKADFKAVMNEIASAIDSIQKRVASLRSATKALMSDIKAEHKEAAAHWAFLPERYTATEEAAEEAAEAAEEPKPVHKKTKRSKK